MSIQRDLKDQAIKNNPINAFNLITNTPPFPLVEFGSSGMRTRVNDLQVFNGFVNNVWLDPMTGGWNNMLNTGGSIDFWLREGMYDIIDKVTLKLTLTNTSAAAAVYPNMLQLFQRISVACNQGSDLLSQYDGDYLFCMTSTYGNVEWALKSQYLNTNQQWQNNASGLPAGASATYYIPFTGSALNQIKLNMKYIKGDVRVKFELRPWTTFGQSGTAPQITTCGLILNQTNLDAGDMELKRAVYKTINGVLPPPIQYRYLDQLYFSNGGVAMVPSNKYTYVLNSIRGMVSHLYFFLRPAGATGNNLNAFQNIASFDITDSNGTSIIQWNEDAAFNLSNEYPDFFPDNALTSYLPLYTYSFATSPKDNYAYGTQSGYWTFTNYEKIVITTPSTLVSGNYELVVYAAKYCNVFETDGLIQVKNGAV